MDVIFVSEAMFMIVLKIGSRKINSIFSETWAAYEIKRKKIIGINRFDKIYYPDWW